MKNIAKVILLCCMFSNTSYSQLKINEFSCSNFTTVADLYGEYGDWVEIYNPGATAVNLAGYWLSDNASNIQKWQIPSGNVPAGGYTVIHCSGRGLVNGTQIHPKFTLTQTTSEWIIISDPAGTPIDQIQITNITKSNNSVGRQTNGAAVWKLFTTPTPGAANTGAVNFYTTKPIMSIEGGFYAGAQTVTMTCPDAGSTIRYTLDGSTPTATSTLYTAPVSVTTTKVVRARAFSANLLSLITTNTYFINVVDHTIPVVSIAGTDVATLLGGTQINAVGSFELYEEDNSFKDEGVGDFDKHGNDSWAYDQRGFDFTMRDEYGYNNDINHDIFPERNRGKFQRLILKPGANDNYPAETGNPAYIRDAYVHTLSQKADLKLDARAWRPCALYLNGAYWGLYEIREKADDADYTDKYYDQDKYNLQYLKTWGNTEQDYGAPNALPDWTAFLGYVTANNLSVPANFDYVDARYNWKSAIDYFVINSVTVCTDWLNWNTAWWRGMDPTGDGKKWRYALWDMDATFGHYINYTGVPDIGPDADPCNAENLPNPGGRGHTTILKKLIEQVPLVEQYYQARYADLLNTSFSCGRMIAVLDSMITEITPEMPRQLARWGGNMATWQANVQVLRDFINTRCVSLNQGLVDCYALAGPYNLKVAVSPVGVNPGEVKVNSVWAPSYTWNATYFGGMNNNIIARANPPYVFDHWEVNTSTLTQAATSDTNAIVLVANDSLIAVFIDTTGVVIPPSYTMIVNVEPVGAGTVKVDGITIAPYPNTATYTGNVNHPIIPTAVAPYMFEKWRKITGTLASANTTPLNGITLVANDSLIAVFKDTTGIPPASYNVVINVEPAGAGLVTFDGAIVPTYPFATTKLGNVNYPISASDIPPYVFDSWRVVTGTLAAGVTINSNGLTLVAPDSLVAVYVDTTALPIPPPVPPIPLDFEGVFIPSGFSPNGDGYNDLLEIKVGNTVSFFNIRLFDRWGHLMFETSSAANPWTGIYEGKVVNSGVYAYQIDITYIKGGRKELKSGNVTVVR